jgi:DNA-binding transcriptional MerR regulator
MEENSMEYTINKLAKMAGISTRTLRWYDECGLLKPKRINSNGYRIYGQEEIDRLQQILFYRELGVELSEITKILNADAFDGLIALKGHLAALQNKREQIDRLITIVEKSICAWKGEIDMSDQEKFEGFKQKRIDENEMQYGKESRAKYGDAKVNASNDKLKRMTKEEYAQLEQLTEELNNTLKAACEQHDPTSEVAQKAADLHRQWLSYYWPAYTKEAHIGITQMYVADERFTAYYEKIAPGSAALLRDAVAIYCRG